VLKVSWAAWSIVCYLTQVPTIIILIIIIIIML
jgi:hypothetical protein